MQHRRIVLCIALACTPTSAFAAHINGHVLTAGGKPASGALITAFNADRSQNETVYSAPDGSYGLATDFTGRIKLRARLPYYDDITKMVDSAAAAPVDFQLTPAKDPKTLAEQITAAGHLTQLQWQDPALRDSFISQCNYCHQIGNALTRVPRPKADWMGTIGRMQGYFALLTNAEADGVANTLVSGFQDKPVQAVETYDAQPELSHATVHEWLVGDGNSFIHDTIVGADGKLYGADEGHDVIWALDRSSGKAEQYKLPDVDLPQGGMFSGLELPIGIFTGKHGPHSMAQAKDGRIWFTNALSSMLGSFDPATKQFHMYPLGRRHLYPHTIRIDARGIVWFTCVAANEVIRFDPVTETFTPIGLPSNGFWHWVANEALPLATKFAAWWAPNDPNDHIPGKRLTWGGTDHKLMNFPYGIDISPTDGSIWYAKLNADRIGRIDPVTLAITEYATPAKGPRRPRFDKHGMLWIPAFGDSALLRFDPATASFKTWKLPLLAPGEYEVPYALNVHPDTGDIWITSNLSDRSFRFIPAEERFITYPSPTRVTWLRDWDFTKDGQACSSNSNLPAYGTEDGVAAFICINPGHDKPASPAKG